MSREELESRARWEAAVVLAGGKSERMGSEKALLAVEGTTLIERLLGMLATRFGRILVSVGARGPSPGLVAAMARSAAATGLEPVLVRDRDEGLGALEGVRAALESLAPAARGAFVPADSTGVSFELVAALWDEASAPMAAGAVPRWSRGLEPAWGVYSPELVASIRRLRQSGEHSLQALAREPGVRVLDLEDAAVARQIFGSAPRDPGSLFLNLNTPADYRAWLASRAESFRA